MREFKTGATRNDDHDKFGIRGFRSRYADQAFYEYMHRHRVQADGKLREPDNWKKGIPTEAYYNGLDRHVHDVLSIAETGRAFRTNEDGSVVTLKDALCAIEFNIHGLLHELGKAEAAASADQPAAEPVERGTCDNCGVIFGDREACRDCDNDFSHWTAADDAATHTGCDGCKWLAEGSTCDLCDIFSLWTAEDDRSCTNTAEGGR